MEQAKPRILVVEDEAAIRDGLADVLVYHGYKSTRSRTARRASRRRSAASYDLLLLDVMLPGRDGFSICDEVRKVDRDQPIIMLTAKTSDEDIVNGLTLGADDYVAKPFAIAQLVLRVKAVLRRSRVGVESRGEDRARRRRRDRHAQPFGPPRHRDARVHSARDRDPPVSAVERRAPGVARGAAHARLGLRPHGRDRDAHGRHPHREAAAQDRARREGAAQSRDRARRRLSAR